MKLLTCCLVLAGTATALAQPPVLLWGRQLGTTADDIADGIGPDGAGGFIVSGRTYGDLAGPNAGIADGFVARYDDLGNQLWVRQFGTSQFEQCRGMATSSNGSSSVVGSTSGVLGAASFGGADAFLAAFDPAGNQVYIRQFGSADSDFALGVASGAGNHVLVGGHTYGSLGGPSAGQGDAFLARFDAATNQLVWIRQLGTAFDETGNGVALDGAGGAYLCGFTEGSLGGPLAGSTDAFVARYDSAGNRLWIRQVGSAGTELAGVVETDGAGGVVLLGYTGGSLFASQIGNMDIFLVRYDGAGNQMMTRQFGTPEFEYGSDLAPALGGTLLFTGVTYGDLWGTNAGSTDGLLARFDPVANTFLWGMRFGGQWTDAITGVTQNSAGRIFVIGDTNGPVGGPSLGGTDVFVGAFGPPCYADCNGDSTLNLADFGCFQTKFALGDPYADCNGDSALNLADFGCFQTKFALGCP